MKNTLLLFLIVFGLTLTAGSPPAKKKLAEVKSAKETSSPVDKPSKPLPDNYPPGTKVVLSMPMVTTNRFQLGPRSTQLFLSMLTNQPVHTEISRMPALPQGTFLVGTNKYLWHGNGVIRGTGDEERLWHGPYLQRLISAKFKEPKLTRTKIQSILDKLEKDPTVASTKVEGPGAYPGGGDALHPVTLGDPTGWKTFTPKK